MEAEEALLHTALYGTYSPLLEEAQDLLRELAGRGWRIILATSAGGPS
ncbi:MULTISPECIES: hypothetical protein [unclassified Streptomyces]|nr:hypothetical protein [Streptomyces sp. CB01635]